MSLSSLFDGRFGSFIAIFIAICVVGLVVTLAMRAWGRGIKPSAGRRLGIVDAFDLDRHRQLVIIRRDHVEHLIMIGGPNDLVIESDIVRSQQMSGEGRRDPVVAPSPAMAPSQAAPTPTVPSATATVAPPVDLRPTPPMPRANPMTPPPRAPEVKTPVAPPVTEPTKAEVPRLSMNINSLEEEMTRLLGRPPEKKD
jgi:flagellar protein FliO/FliZ